MEHQLYAILFVEHWNIYRETLFLTQNLPLAASLLRTLPRFKPGQLLILESPSSRLPILKTTFPSSGT